MAKGMLGVIIRWDGWKGPGIYVGDKWCFLGLGYSGQDVQRGHYAQERVQRLGPVGATSSLQIDPVRFLIMLPSIFNTFHNRKYPRTVLVLMR
jgi:hypothetical protein